MNSGRARLAGWLVGRRSRPGAAQVVSAHEVEKSRGGELCADWPAQLTPPPPDVRGHKHLMSM